MSEFEGDPVTSWTYQTKAHSLNRVFVFLGGSVKRALAFHHGNTLWGYCEYKDGKPYLLPDVVDGEIPLFSDPV